MADERDPKVSQRYRELGAEAPPRHVDEAILAASRRAAEMHPAPLVPPTGRRRWYFPVAAAAIIMLSVAVTWHMQVERPDPEGYVASAPAPAAQAPKEEARADAQMQAQRAEPARDRRMQEAAPLAGARASKAVEPPEKWLERITELRKQGKHEEADKALEAFRKAYPGYKLPESVLRK